jgi:hypothetical protein
VPHLTQRTCTPCPTLLMSTRLPAQAVLSLSLHPTLQAAEAAAKAAAPTPSPEVTQAAAKVPFLLISIRADCLHYITVGLTACIHWPRHQPDLFLVPHLT